MVAPSASIDSRSTMTRSRRIGVSLLASVAMLAAACTGATTSRPGPPAIGGVVTIANANGTLWTCDFNPYRVSENGDSLGLIYETLIYDNLLNDKKTPWLASSYAWSA